ncbi:MAG: MFS transporter [Candidatus Omnitrophica bacterium]|nr:MFS transporter [Candidatus Omnitrophota bacterium]
MKSLPRGAVSWAFYDFANTIYSAVVVTVYLPLYFTASAGRAAPLGLSATLSMVLSGFLIPPLGRLSDRTGKTKQYLLISTLACVSATAGLSWAPSQPWLLAGFVAANLLFHCSLVFYNSLLPVVAPPERQGFVSGLGTGLGYAGVLLALPLAHAADIAFGRRWVFLVAAALFLAFSLPLAFRVPERAATQPQKIHWRQTLALLADNRPLALFLLGNFFAVDVLNTFILWISVFLKQLFSVSQGVLIQTILALNASAFGFGILLGKLTDRHGARRIYLVSVGSLALVVAGSAAASSFAAAACGIVLLGGLSVAGIWTAGRKAVAELAPPDRIGECFGLYGLTTKVSAVGSATFSLLADAGGYRLAVLSQLLPLLAAYFLVRRTASARVNGTP